MARTIQQLYDSMITAKESQPGLAGLTSTSQTAIFKLLFYVVAICQAVFEQIMDVFKADIDYLKSTIKTKDEIYWKDQMLNVFQYNPNDSSSGVVVRNRTNYTWYYRIVDPTLRIVKFCSVTSIDGQGTIKIAEADVNGLPTQCSIGVTQSAYSFVSSVQDTGENLIVTSFNSDTVKLSAQVYYNAQYVQSTVQNWIEDAVASYFEQLPFDGTFLRSSLVEYIKGIQGGDVIRDFYITDIQAKPADGAFIQVERLYPTTSGYIKLDTTQTNYEFIAQK